MPIENEDEVGFLSQLSELEYDGVEECCNANGCCLRGFWVLVLIAFAVPIYIYNDQIYSSFTAKTSVTSIDEIRTDQLEFPNLTICARNRFNRTYIKDTIRIPDGWQQMNMTIETIQENFATYILSMAYQSVNFDQKTSSYMAHLYDYNFNKDRDIDIYKFVPDVENTDAFDIKIWLKNAGLQCSSFLTRCLFVLKDFSCCDNTMAVISDYGVCWQLKIQPRDNRSTDAYQTMAGTNMGTVISTTLESNLVNEDEFDFRLHIGDSLNPVDVDINSVIIPQGYQAVVRLDVTKYVMDPNSQQCLVNPIQLAYHDGYNQGLCENECLLNVSLAKCQCGALGYGANINSDQVCSPYQMQNCFLPLRLAQRQKKNKEIEDCVSSKCLSMCEYVSYQPYVTFTGLASSDNDPSYFMLLVVYFGDIKYTSIQSQLLTDINALVMGIGGVCGLWTGMSVITVVQLCVFIVFYPLYRKAEQDMAKKNEKTAIEQNDVQLNTHENEKENYF